MYATNSSAVFRQALAQQICQHVRSVQASILCLGFTAHTQLKRNVKQVPDTKYVAQRFETFRTINTCAHASVEDLDSSDGEDQPNQFLPAILLAYFASQNRSLLAAECLIETVIEMYRRGTRLDSLQFTLSMATLQSGSTLLSEQELDVLTARCGIIMLTLHEIGCATYEQPMQRACKVALKQSEGNVEQQPLSSKAQQLTKGLGKFVSQIINMYKSGFNSRRMLLQQSLAKGVEAGGQGVLAPSVITMQQNTRLVVLTLEMIQQSQIPINVPLESISPEENYSSDEELPSSSSSADSAPLSDVPTAAARKAQLEKPYAQQQNSSGFEDISAQQHGKTARTQPTRGDQDEEDEQAAPSVSEDEEEHVKAAPHMRQSSTGGQVENVAAIDPRKMSTSPSSAHRSPDQVLSPTGYILGFTEPDPKSHSSNPPSLSQSPNSIPAAPVSGPQSSEHTPESALGSPPHKHDIDHARSAAVQLLLGFMGALQASQYAVESFVSNVIRHYRHGWSAQQLFDQLQQDEFGQTGGLLPTDPRIQAATDTPAHLTAELFARWLSTAFMTLAVMGLPHPQAPQAAGWAWVTLPESSSASYSAIQAHRLAEVVANKLRLEEEGQQAEGMSWQLSESAQAMRNSSALQQMASQVNRAPQQDQYVVLEDPDLPRTSTGYNVLVQQLELITLTRKFVTEHLRAESQSEK